MECLEEMFERTSQRFRCLLCTAIEQRAREPRASFDRTVIVHCLLQQLRAENENAHTRCVSDREVLLADDLSIHYGSRILSALESLFLHMNTNDAQNALDPATIHELLHQVLRQSNEDLKRKCAMAMLKVLRSNTKLPFLANFLNQPLNASNTDIIFTGLSMIETCSKVSRMIGMSVELLVIVGCYRT